MATFRVMFAKEWTEYGEAIIEADNEDAALDEARQMLSEDSDEIEWESSNMDPGDQRIECITEQS